MRSCLVCHYPLLGFHHLVCNPWNNRICEVGMPLNKQSGNMYPFVTHTWNPIRGRCPHDCVYCYMKGKPVGELRFEEKELKTNLGEGRFIFVGSSTDMFATMVPEYWIFQTLYHCRQFKNTYLFQTKNPQRFLNFIFPENSIFGTTIETNRKMSISRAPEIYSRKHWICHMSRRMVSIEPILDFDLDSMILAISYIRPEFVSIGADSKGHNLPEPSPDKVKVLIEELKKFTEVKIKDNLKRLL